MKTLLTTLTIAMLLAAPARGEIKHYGATGQTLYARVQTGTTTFVACALPEGSGGGAGVYTATDAALVTAGLTTANLTGYPFTIRSGSPSTTANDPIVGAGQIAWSGAVEVPIAVDLLHAGGTAIGSTGTLNFRQFFDGSGYGPLIYRTTISVVDSSTEFTIGGPFGDFDGSINGCTIVAHDADDTHRAVRTVLASADAGGNTSITLSSSPGFALVAGSIVEILPPGFASLDRSTLNSAGARVATALPNVAAGANGGLPTVDANNAVKVQSGTGTGQISLSSGIAAVNVAQWSGANVATPNVAGVPKVDITHILGSPASAVSGPIDVNVIKLDGSTINVTP